jgi:hypothetical protein
MQVSNLKLDTIEGEIKVTKEAICEVIQRGISHVTFESNSKIVIDVIWNFEFSILTSHTKSLLFFNFEVKFVKRSFNIVAPILTEIVYSRINCYLYELISLHIETILINEMN